jgi:hypothetical protein
MASQNRIEGDLYVNGNFWAKSQTVAAGAIADAQVAAGAGIAATKLQHQHRATYAQPNTTTTTETRALHRVFGATGTVIGFSAGNIAVNAGAATITVDLKKNGVSILTGVITLDNTNTNRVAEAGSIASGSVVAGDLLEIVVTATAGGGTLGTGFFCSATINEDPA